MDRNTIARRFFAAPAPVRWTLERPLATSTYPHLAAGAAAARAIPFLLATLSALPPFPSSHRRPSRTAVLRRIAHGRPLPLGAHKVFDKTLVRYVLLQLHILYMNLVHVVCSFYGLV